MSTTSSRRQFIEKTTLSAFGIMGLSELTQAANAPFLSTQMDNSLHANFPSQDPKLVQEMVGAAHGQLDKVKELLAAHPELAKATWDWGYGDWETALGAASHVGSREIAELLMANGARPDIFTFAMLGNLQAVKGMVEGNSGVQRIAGPHGITLLAHAQIRLKSKNITENDKKNVQEVVDYLTSLGDANTKATSLETVEELKKQYVGTYIFGTNPNEALVVELNKQGFLAIKRGEQFGRTLNRVEEHGFAPVGAPYVRIRFDMKDNQAVAVSVHDPAPLIKATRQ